MSEIVAIVLLLQRKKNIFSNFSIFAFFVRTFSFYIFWCMENYKSILSCLSFSVLRLIFLPPLTFPKVVEQSIPPNIHLRIHIHSERSSKVVAPFFHVWFLLIYARSFVYTKSFFDKSFRLPKVLLLSVFYMKSPS